jgi:hypothetical protein
MKRSSMSRVLVLAAAALGLSSACTGPDPGGFTPVDGVVTKSPTCPGAQRPGQVCTAPVAGVVVRRQDGGIVLRATTDARGHFSIGGHATDVTLTVDVGDTGLRCPAVHVIAQVGVTTHQDIDCDTGIR